MDLTNLRDSLDEKTKEFLGNLKKRTDYMWNDGVYTPEHDSELKAGLTPFDNTMATKVISFSKDVFHQVCQKGEEKSTYQQTRELNVEIVNCLYERMYELVIEVTKRKLEKDPELVYVRGDEVLEMRIQDENEERKRIAYAVKTAYEVGLIESGVTEETITTIIEEMLKITRKVQVDYIKKIREEKGLGVNKNPASRGWDRTKMSTCGGFGNR